MFKKDYDIESDREREGGVLNELLNASELYGNS